MATQIRKSSRLANIMALDPAALITEKELLSLIRELATLLGWAIYTTWLSKFSPAGFPDLVLVKPPRVLFVELKTMRGKMKPKQEEWAALLRQCPGVEYYMWRPSDWDHVVTVLQKEVL